MNNSDLQTLLETAIEAAQAASRAILDIYGRKDLGLSLKADDSPLTQADQAAHTLIKDALAATGLPLLSEEGREIPYAERRHWEYFWLVDPLDGTKEFVRRNGEFTVNIALIEGQRPVLGVVQVPVTNVLYAGAEGLGAFRRSGSETLALKTHPLPLTAAGLKVVASRSHQDVETEAFLAGLDRPEVLAMGSSLKFMLLAEGSAQLYPRFGPTREWDTAAAQALLTIAGGRVTLRESDQPLVYNKPSLLNPAFLAQA